MACLDLPYFSTLSHKRHDFRGKNYLIWNLCFNFLYNIFFLKYFSFWEEFSEISSKMYTGLRVKYPSFLSDFNETWIFDTHFGRILKYNVSWQSVQWKQRCSMRTDGRKDMTRLIAPFRKFTDLFKTWEGYTIRTLWRHYPVIRNNARLEQDNQMNKDEKGSACRNCISFYYITVFYWVNIQIFCDVMRHLLVGLNQFHLHKPLPA
jgi:hypothetical protein